MSGSARIDVKDRLTAETLETLSSLTVLSPALRKITEPKIPHVPVRWKHARTISALALSNKQIYPANWEAGLTPKNYPEAAILALPKSEIDERQEKFGGIHAVAYALGSAVMVGVMHNQEIFQATEDNSRYQVAMGIGRDALVASGGLWTPETRQLWIPETAIESGGTLPVGQIPSDVPYV